MLGKLSSSIKERLEGMLASSTFESKLYKATSNSTAHPPTTAELYSIADHSFVREDLIKILVTLKQRLESAQRDKWKRLRKTLQLAEFLLLNGSMEFAAYLDDRLRPLVVALVEYECDEGYEDRGLGVREAAKRIVALCANRDKLRQARAEAKQRRARFVGISSADVARGYSARESEELPPSAAHLRKLFEAVDAAPPPEEWPRGREDPSKAAELPREVPKPAEVPREVPKPRQCSPEPNFLD